MLSRIEQSNQAVGMPGFAAIDFGFDAGSLDMEITLGGWDVGLLKTWGVSIAYGMQIRFAGSNQNEATGERCRVKSRRVVSLPFLTLALQKAGEDMAHKYPLKNTYFKLTSSG
ncbi:phage major tail tube protein [Pectobacterium carotovorum]|nr:phage major tail tube protein [Pectobacterium carotovorum]MDX6915445.1 phage major tail tube protein [Pectobacterium carotovorum]